jgi:hypothetical protein
MKGAKGGYDGAACSTCNTQRGGTAHVQKLDGKVLCKLCGAQLDIPKGETPKVTFHAVTGGPLTRVLKVATDEVHRCDVLPPRS